MFGDYHTISGEHQDMSILQAAKDRVHAETGAWGDPAAWFIVVNFKVGRLVSDLEETQLRAETAQALVQQQSQRVNDVRNRVW